MKEDKRGQVYFVTDGEAIKIGFCSSNLRKRLKQLQVSHSFPLFLLGSIPATASEEYVIHRRFGHLRMAGEWFRKAPELFRFIDDFDDSGEMIPGDDMEEYKIRVAALNNR